jgi:DNA (cytosine-5)-methyltransferase 1
MDQLQLEESLLVRPDKHNAAVSNGGLSFVSLYSGAGGLDLGFIRAGMTPLWAVDSDRFAVETYRANLGDHIVCGDLPETAPPDHLRPDVVIGGPPCQGFSVIGRMDPADPRSRHVFHLVDVAANLCARGFVLENVKNLAASPRWREVRQALMAHAASLGFEVRMMVLNAAHYEVPQARERMFLIGLRDGLISSPRPVSEERPPTVREALAGLPRVGEPGNGSLCQARVVPARVPVMRPTAHKGSLLFNGSGRPLLLDEPAKTLPASMGGNATPIIDQAELERGAPPWVVDYHARLAAGEAPVAEAPARMRRLTVEEAAALQTFPSGFEFVGPQVAQYRQIGNAVPPNLAFHVATAVRASLRVEETSEGRDAALIAS